MKIYTALRIRTGPSKWAVVPLTTKFVPAPEAVAWFDAEDKALAEAARLNLEQAGVISRGVVANDRRAQQFDIARLL